MKADVTALRLAAVLWYCEIAAVDGRVDRYIELAAAPLEPRPVFPSDEYASFRGVAAGARNSSSCCQHYSRGEDKGSHCHCRGSRLPAHPQLQTRCLPAAFPDGMRAFARRDYCRTLLLEMSATVESRPRISKSGRTLGAPAYLSFRSAGKLFRRLRSFLCWHHSRRISAVEVNFSVGPSLPPLIKPSMLSRGVMRS